MANIDRDVENAIKNIDKKKKQILYKNPTKKTTKKITGKLNKPRNHGKPWTKNLKEEVIDLYKQGHSINKISQRFERTSTSIELTIRENEILDIISMRNIKKLFHFTDARNIETIKKYGILPITRLNEKDIKYYANDLNRFDGQTGGISLSISSRNHGLLKRYHERNPRSWVEIEISPEVAATRNCLFYDYNAADSKFRNNLEFSEDYLQSPNAFSSMFSDRVESSKYSFNREDKKPFEPTSPQAEIIVRWLIPKSKILNFKEINV